MPNLTKLDETIDQLEKQANGFSQHSKVLSKVSELTVKIEKSITQITEGNQNFEGIKKDLQNSLKSLNSEVVSLKKQNETQIQELISTNKRMIRELDENISSRLSRFSSDIQISIREEGTQIQRSIELLFKESILNLEKSFTEKMIKQQKTQLIVVIITALTIIGSIILSKLF